MNALALHSQDFPTQRCFQPLNFRFAAFDHLRSPALAFGPIGRYLGGMLETLRRAVTILVALTFVAGLLPHGMRAADAGVKMVMTAASDMPMSGECHGCGDDQKAMTSAACSAYCGSLVALPLLGTVFESSSTETIWDCAGPALVDHSISPEPYPPRSAVLS